MNYYLISTSLCLFFSFNSHNLGRLWSITDDFATIPFRLVLFSTALAELAKFISVHSLILSFISSSHYTSSSFSFYYALYDCLCQTRRPSDVAKPPSCLFHDQGPEFIIFSNGCLDPLANLLIGNMVFVRNVQKRFISSQRPTFFSLTRCCRRP